MNKKVVIISSVVAGLVVIGGLILYYKKKKASEAAPTASTGFAVDKVMQQPSYADSVNYVDSGIPNYKFEGYPQLEVLYA
jgi:fructose-1-phosphate kinase PfkB-like protein